ncbi:hypothetical protein B0T17DRAFT_533479 [Bombardia bombarda]|uniref:Uncharacterized protein n=1 Tax=Bombardia bombarda TaxID=252184 RepID=A0AA40C192_9PEZI|nr:hypothetical protein B0T17DRAFT_533479 [Bombardia bombarda]
MWQFMFLFLPFLFLFLFLVFDICFCFVLSLNLRGNDLVRERGARGGCKANRGLVRSLAIFLRREMFFEGSCGTYDTPSRRNEWTYAY